MVGETNEAVVELRIRSFLYVIDVRLLLIINNLIKCVVAESYRMNGKRSLATKLIEQNKEQERSITFLSVKSPQ